MATISGSVGRGGLNRRPDVITIQTLINHNIRLITPLHPLQIDGVVGPKTISAIEEFQRRVLHMQRPDGRIDPLGQTLRKLDSSKNLGASQGSSLVPAVSDPAIETLHLAATAKKAAYALKKIHPTIVFTSGRRNKADQARAMAGNVVSNRQWIKQTYADTKASRECQKWIDNHPAAKTQSEIAAGLLSVLNGLSDTEIGRLSKHLSGEAFDVQPVTQNANEIKATIRKLPGLTKFLDREGGLVRWHAQF